MKADVTKRSEVQAMVDTALKQYGRLDILINNAGATLFKGLDNTNRKLQGDEPESRLKEK